MVKSILQVGGFTINRRIGTGARSTIYLATDDQNGHEVALKRVIVERPEDQRIVEQVQNEYDIARHVDHPYIRKCLKIKRVRRAFKLKELLLAMEYFDGQSLEDRPALSLVDVLLVFRMVANGLQNMHHVGFIHCDIKPNNILLDKSGSIKIIDLGQGCKLGTTKQRIQGTPDYIAPEQVKRKPLTCRTDIFNLGATMYWALTGHHVPTLIPKKNDPLGLLAPRQCRPPHQLRTKLPLDVSNLVMDCIKEEPSGRPPNMSAIISRLDVIIHGILGNRIRKNADAAQSG